MDTWIQIIYTFTFLFYGPAILKSGVFGLHCHTGMIIRLPTLGERKTAQIFCFPAFFKEGTVDKIRFLEWSGNKNNKRKKDLQS